MRQTLCDLLDQQFRTRPQATAIRSPGRSWTYAELDRLTAQLAHRLCRRSIGPDRVVALLVPRVPQALFGLVAILRSGAACLPLSPEDPPRRNETVLTDTGCQYVLTLSPLDWWPDTQLIDDPSLAEESADAASLPRPSPLNLAYAITTSGSTGQPKVVGVPHKGIINLMAASMTDLDLIRPDDVMLWTTALNVDSTMHDCLMPLCCGACVAVAHDGDLRASRMLPAVRALRATVLDIPSAVLGPYGRSLLPPLAEAGVRLVITGGSQLDGPGLAETKDLVVYNGYGPTEASVAATWYRCVTTTPNWAPIGQPIRGVRTYVLDDALAPVPVDAAGQLYIAGAGLARGYLGLPGRTAAVFMPDPFAEEPGERMYATGDRVRQQADGDLVYLGRLDDQVKVSGFRVEIGEVEHSLRECPGVADAAALLCRGLPGGAAIVAFLAGERVADEVIANHLRDRLPNHMLPRFYLWLDELPLNFPGKVDRALLESLAVAQITARPRDAPLSGPRGFGGAGRT